MRPKDVVVVGKNVKLNVAADRGSALEPEDDCLDIVFEDDELNCY